MFKSARYGAIAYTILGPILLSGCGGSHPAVQASTITTPTSVLAPVKLAPPKPVRKFTLNTPVERIAADPNGKAILDRDVPGLMASRDYPMFDDMSLSQIALLSGGRLTKTKLSLVQTDLVQLSDLNP